jgi:hypothetical protein
MRHLHLGHYAACAAVAALVASVFVVGDVPSTVLAVLAVALATPLVVLRWAQHPRDTPQG